MNLFDGFQLMLYDLSQAFHVLASSLCFLFCRNNYLNNFFNIRTIVIHIFSDITPNWLIFLKQGPQDWSLKYFSNFPNARTHLLWFFQTQIKFFWFFFDFICEKLDKCFYLILFSSKLEDKVFLNIFWNEWLKN